MQKGNVVFRKAKREHNGNGAGGNMSVYALQRNKSMDIPWSQKNMQTQAEFDVTNVWKYVINFCNMPKVLLSLAKDCIRQENNV